MNKKKVVSSLTLKFIDNIAVKAIGFIISVILARLLAPEIFGITAIILAVVAIMQTFVDSGLGTALIQNKDTDNTDYSTVFYISVAIAAIFYTALFFIAPLITTYYDISEYLLHFRVLSTLLLFYSFRAIPSAKLTREMHFKKMLFCQLTSTLISGVIGVVLAYAGFGIWALIFYYVSHSAVSCIVYGFASGWHPELKFSIARAKVLFDYGYKLLLSGLLCSLFSNLRTFIIGRIYSKTELGLYTRGEQVPSIVSTTIDGAFKSVMLPVYSKKQDSIQSIRSVLSKTIALNSYLNFPIMLGFAVIAPAVVMLLYSQKWEDCIPYLQLLSIANLHISVTSPCLIAIEASGHSDKYLRLEIVRRLIMLAILGVSLCFNSLIAIAIGWIVSTIIDVFVIMVPTKRLIGYTLKNLFADVFQTLLLSIVMAVPVWFIGKLALSNFVLLIIQVVCGIAVYLLGSIVLKIKFFFELKTILLSFIRKGH